MDNVENVEKEEVKEFKMSIGAYVIWVLAACAVFISAIIFIANVN